MPQGYAWPSEAGREQKLFLVISTKIIVLKNTNEITNVRKSRKNMKAKLIAGIAVLAAAVVAIGTAGYNAFKNRNNNK